MELLLKEHADINYQRQDGATALILASQDGHYQVVELLLKEHADVNHQAQDGVTALILASENGHYQVIDLLKEYAIDVPTTDSRRTPQSRLLKIKNSLKKIVTKH